VVELKYRLYRRLAVPPSKFDISAKFVSWYSCITNIEIDSKSKLFLVVLQDGTNVDALRTEILSRWESSLAASKASAAQRISEHPAHQTLSANPGSSDSAKAELNGGQVKTVGDQLDEIIRFASESAEKSGTHYQSRGTKSSLEQPDPKLRAAILSTMSDVREDYDKL
jgi:hypothetical protein